MTITGREVVERIRHDAADRGFAWADETIDTRKAGDLDRPVHGIATTWMATSDALRRAVDAGCDLVISHEPTFWDHFDVAPIVGPRAAWDEKNAWISEHGVTVWRYHDHHHATFPHDPVMGAFFERVGWSGRDDGRGFRGLVRLDPVPLRDLAADLARRLGTDAIRLVGDPDELVRTIGFGGHDVATAMPSIPDADLILIGEVREWDGFEYFRDATRLGQAKALVAIPHGSLETWGSMTLAGALDALIPEVPVVAVEAPQPFALHRLGAR
jgi:putative NIF3 family GTP cyclohydrolase 1 type 2